MIIFVPERTNKSIIIIFVIHDNTFCPWANHVDVQYMLTVTLYVDVQHMLRLLRRDSPTEKKRCLRDGAATLKASLSLSISELARRPGLVFI
jgi:hypothetical protein